MPEYKYAMRGGNRRYNVASGTLFCGYLGVFWVVFVGEVAGVYFDRVFG